MANHAAYTLVCPTSRILTSIAEFFKKQTLNDGFRKAKALSTSAVIMNKRVRELLEADIKLTREHLILRPMEVTNCPQPVSQMQIIALNSAIEVDIYGNLNLSHLMGSRVVMVSAGLTDLRKTHFYHRLAFLPLKTVTFNHCYKDYPSGFQQP
jgi:hypothetical protein